MAYIGQQPVVGRYILLDQISGGFNGTTSGFTMSTAGGVQGVKPGLAQNVLLSLGGVIQQPGVDYTISGSGITFTTPPVSGTTFFATVLGDAQSVGTPSDGTVTPASIAAGFDFAFPNVNVTGVTTIASGVAATPSLSITGDADTGIFSPAADTLGFATAGVQRLSIETGEVVVNDGSSDVDFRVESNGQAHMLFVDGGNDRIGIGKSTPRSAFELGIGHIVVPAFGRIGTGGSGDTPETAFRFTSADNISAIVGNSEKLRIDNSGNVGIGTTAPSVPLTVNSTPDHSDIAIFHAGGGTPNRGLKISTFSSTNTNAGVEFDAQHNTGAFKFSTGGTERLRIDSSGRVLIGATSGTELLEVHGDTPVLKLRDTSSYASETGPAIGFQGNDSNEAIKQFSTIRGISQSANNGQLAFDTRTGGSLVERMRIDSSGRLLIGTTSSIAVAGAETALQVEGTTADTSRISVINRGNNTGGGGIQIAKSRGTQPALVQEDDQVGGIFFAAGDANDFVSQPAKIECFIDGAPSGSDTPGRLTFSTCPDQTDAPVERLRIDSFGRLLVGTTTSQAHASANLVEIGNYTLTNAGITINSPTDGAGLILFGDSSSSNRRGRIEYTHVSDAFRLYTADSERMRIDSSGNVGIGTSSPGAKLEVVGSDDANNLVVSSGNTDFAVYNDDTIGEVRLVAEDGSTNNNSKFLSLHTQASGASSSTERMRIDSSGNVGIGKTSSGNKLEIEGQGNTKVVIDARTDASNGSLASLELWSKNGSGTNNFGQIEYDGDGSFIIGSAGSGGGSVPITFRHGSTERARIDTSGRLIVGTSTLSNYGTVNAYTNTSTPGLRCVAGSGMGTGSAVAAFDKHQNVNSTSQVFVIFTINSQNTGSGQINANGSSQAAFGSFSDRRLKENIVDLPSQLDNVCRLRPVEFDYIQSEGGGHQTSFIAQEFEEVFPDAVGEREDGMKTLTGWGKTEAILVKALQEAVAKIEILEASNADLLARVTALES